MSVELWFSTDSEEENYESIAMERKKLRDHSDPLDQPEQSFIQYFRVSKQIFQDLLQTIDAKVERAVFSSIPANLMLAAALRFFAEGNYQKGVGNDRFIAMAQPTISKVLKTVLKIIEQEVCPAVIRFPSDEDEKSAIRLAFYEKAGFPGVIGCVDGTHVSIIPPARDKHLYYNRKGFHSLNVMLVCDNNLMIRYVDANNPGSSHDSFIWNGSTLNELLAQRQIDGERNSWLLGDAGYPLKPFLITPYRTGSNITAQRTRFNEIHSKTRITVERSIGVLKNTFRCILGARQLYYKPEKAAQIVNVCVALHNLRIKHKVTFDEPELAVDENAETLHAEVSEADDAIGIREDILRNLF